LIWSPSLLGLQVCIVHSLHNASGAGRNDGASALLDAASTAAFSALASGVIDTPN
jgi:hypothetical protein